MPSGTVYKHEIALARQDGQVNVINEGTVYYDLHYQLFNPHTHTALLSELARDLNKPDWKFDQSNVSPANQTTYRKYMRDLFRGIDKERPLLSAVWVRGFQDMGDALEIELGKTEQKAAFYQRASRTLNRLHTMRRGTIGRQREVGTVGEQPSGMPHAVILRTFRFQPPNMVLAP